jgi:hypothetical protein
MPDTSAHPFIQHPECATGQDWHDHYQTTDTACPQCLALLQRDSAKAIATALYDCLTKPDESFYCLDCALRSYRRMMGMSLND